MTRGLKNNFPISGRNVFVVYGIVLALVCMVILASGQVLVRNFDRAEAGLGAQMMRRVHGALESRLGRMEALTRNAALPHQFVDAVRNHDIDYFSAHFGSGAFSGLNIHLAWIIDRDQRDLFSMEIDRQMKRTSPAPGALLAALRPLINDPAVLAKPIAQRFIHTPQGILAFAAGPIGVDENATGATVVFARFLDTSELQRVSELTSTPVEFFVADAQGRFSQVPAQVNDWALHKAGAPDDDILTLDSSNTRMEIYGVVRGPNGRPVGLLATHLERHIGALGRRATWTLMGVITLFIALGGGISLLLLRHLQGSWSAHTAVKRRYEKIIAHLDETIVLVERDTGRIVEANAALLRSLGYAAEELCGLRLGDVYTGLPPFKQAIEEAGRGLVRECRMRGKHQQLIDVEITLTAVTDEGKDLICVVGRDITDRKQAEQQAIDNRRKLSRLANHDSLTGLPNRLFLQSRLPRLLRKLADSDRLLALYYVDVDHFKNINDSRGHASGDQLLRVFAKRLKAATGAHDVVVRMGGDEFVVIASLLPNVSAAESIAARLVATAQAPIILEDTTVSVSASIGISIYPNDGIDAETLLKHADIALYQAKENGRNGYKRFTPNMNVEVGEQVALEQALRHALGTEQLFVEYQPVINLATEQLESFEALVRWRHPELGYVPPMRFIPAAEKCGLIDILGAEVLRKAFMQLAQWQREGVPLAPVAVNISPLQLQRTTLSTLVQELSLEYDVDPQWVHFEITESALLLRNTELIVTLETLRALGSKISIDDFGTGFSNLSYLKHLPVDTIKIDRAFVRDVAIDAGDAAIVASICAIARELRLRIVAEGIETREQLAKLRELGCLYGQGYYFSKPVAAPLCRDMLLQLDELNSRNSCALAG